MVTIEFLKQNHLVLFSTLWFKSKSSKHLQYYSISSLLIPFIIKTKNLNLLDETLDLVFEENDKLLKEFAIRELARKIKKPKTTFVYPATSNKIWKVKNVYISFNPDDAEESIEFIYRLLLPRRLYKQYLNREYTKELSRKNLIREYERIIKLF